MFDDGLTVGEYYQSGTTPNSAPMGTRLITNDFIGIEIELERARTLARHLGNSNPGNFWEIKTDGSLRNNGYEFVFNGPKNGQTAENGLNHYSAVLATLAGANRPLASVRSSIHVHVDVRDLTKQQLLRMLLLYSIFEIVLFKSYARERLASHFCIPLSNCVDLFPSARHLNNGFAAFDQYINHPNLGRYSALNLKAISRFQSVEFRHLGGTLDTDLIYEWANVCLSFKRAIHRDINFATEFFLASQHGFSGHLSQYFPEATVRRVIAYYEANEPAGQFDRDIIDSIVYTQSLCQASVNL